MKVIMLDGSVYKDVERVVYGVNIHGSPLMHIYKKTCLMTYEVKYCKEVIE